MSEEVSEVEENTLRVLLSTMRKHAPEALQRIMFDVMLTGLAEEGASVMVKGESDDFGVSAEDPTVESAVIAIRGTGHVAKFFTALEAAGLDEAEDTEVQ